MAIHFIILFIILNVESGNLVYSVGVTLCNSDYEQVSSVTSLETNVYSVRLILLFLGSVFFCPDFQWNDCK